VVKEFRRKAACQGDFVTGKYDVTLDCVCSW